MLRPHRLLAVLVGLGILAGIDFPQALAGGFSVPVIGGRGPTKLAFVARPDDTSAIYHNPAGLNLLGPYQIDLSGTGILTHTTFNRCSTALFDAQGNPTGCGTSGGAIQFEPPVETVKYGGYPKGFGILPYGGMSGRFGLRNWNFGVAVYSPHNATGAFPDCQRDEDGRPTDCTMAAQRFAAVVGTVNTIYINPAVAYEPHPAISLGLGISAVRAAIRLKRSLWLGGPNSTVALIDNGWNGEGQIDLEASAWSYAINFGFIWNLGPTFAPDNKWLRGLRIGFSYSSQTRFDFKGEMALSSPVLYNFVTENEACRQGNADRYEIVCQAESTFKFPMQIRFGVDWEITREWDVGVDVFWQNYTVYDAIRVTFPEPLILDTGFGDPVSVTETAEPKNSKDVWAVAIGGQYSPKWAPGLEFRLGVMWDQSPYPDNTYTLLNPESDKWGLAFGVGYLFKFGLELSIGYISLWYKDRILRDSLIRPRICEPGDADCQDIAPDAPFSMNGDIRNKRVDLFLLQVGWRFGGGKPKPKAKPVEKPPVAPTPVERAREARPEARRPVARPPVRPPVRKVPKAPPRKAPQPAASPPAAAPPTGGTRP